jgi:hypothetical protein
MPLIKINKEIIAFILIIIISFVNPELIYNLNKFFIGKIILLIIIIFFSSYNIILGLLIIFIYFAILDKYRYVIEGMTGEQSIDTINTIGEQPVSKTDKTNKTNKPNKFEEKKNKIVISTSYSNTDGIDIQDIRDTIASKDSNSFPLSKNMFKSSDDIEPFNIR